VHSKASLASLVGVGAVSAALATGVAHAGSNLRSEGHVHYVGTLGYSTAERRWDQDRNLQDTDCRSAYSNFNHYAEYGYSYYYTVFGQAGLATSQCADSQKSGLSELHLGLRGRLNLYMNDRAWEIEAIVPVHGDQEGRSRIGCSSFGLIGSVERRDEVVPESEYYVGAGAGVQLWEAPLSHQAFGKLAANGPIAQFWSWGANLKLELPLTDRAGAIVDNLSDCGTDSKVLRSGVSLRYSLSPLSSASCGLSASLWGEEASQSYGFSCGYSRRWQ
jgi:hypothetical protein